MVGRRSLVVPLNTSIEDIDLVIRELSTEWPASWVWEDYELDELTPDAAAEIRNRVPVRA